MVKLLFCLTRRSDVPEDEFHRYWREEHAPLVVSHASTLGIRRYVQSHGAHPGVTEALGATRGLPGRFDGVAELWFDSVEALLASVSTPEGAAAGEVLLADERRFIDHARSPIFLAEEYSVI